MYRRDRILTKLMDVFSYVLCDTKDLKIASTFYVSFNKLPMNIFKPKAKINQNAHYQEQMTMARFEDKFGLKMIKGYESWTVKVINFSKLMAESAPTIGRLSTYKSVEAWRAHNGN